MYRYKNKKYNKLSELAQEVGISYATLKSRLDTGMSIEQACTKKVRKNRAIKLKGKQYVSIREACVSLKINESKVWGRLRSGCTLEVAFGFEDKPVDYTVYVKDKKFKSMVDACDYFNLERTTVKKRLDRGWSIDEAFELEDRKSSDACNGKIYVIENKFNNRKYVGITSGTLTSRFNKHKIDARRRPHVKFYRALNKLGCENFSIKLLKSVKTKQDMRKYEIKYINKFNSINKGYNTVMGGCGLEDKYGTPIIYRNVPFISITSLARYLNIPQPSLYYKIKIGTDVSTLEIREIAAHKKKYNL